MYYVILISRQNRKRKKIYFYYFTGQKSDGFLILLLCVPHTSDKSLEDALRRPDLWTFTSASPFTTHARQNLAMAESGDLQAHGLVPIMLKYVESFTSSAHTHMFQDQVSADWRKVFRISISESSHTPETNEHLEMWTVFSKSIIPLHKVRSSVLITHLSDSQPFVRGSHVLWPLIG